MLQKKFWIPILIVLIAVVGCGLFYSKRIAQQEPVKVHKPVEAQQSTTPKPPPPGETAESGHWHGDEWHTEANEMPAKSKPSAETSALPRSPDFLSADDIDSPVPWSNPLMPDDIPEPLKMPVGWVNWDYMALVEDVDPV